MEEPGRLQSMRSLRVGHNWMISLSLFTFVCWRRKWQPTPVFLPGESQDGGAWWAAVYGVTQSQTRLKWLSSSNHFSNLYGKFLLVLHNYSFFFSPTAKGSYSYQKSTPHLEWWNFVEMNLGAERQDRSLNLSSLSFRPAEFSQFPQKDTMQTQVIFSFILHFVSWWIYKVYKESVHSEKWK